MTLKETSIQKLFVFHNTNNISTKSRFLFYTTFELCHLLWNKHTSNNQLNILLSTTCIIYSIISFIEIFITNPQLIYHPFDFIHILDILFESEKNPSWEWDYLFYCFDDITYNFRYKLRCIFDFLELLFVGIVSMCHVILVQILPHY